MWWFFAWSLFVSVAHAETFIRSESALQGALDACEHHVCDLVFYDSTKEFNQDSHPPRPNVPLIFVDSSVVRSTQPALAQRRSLRLATFERETPPNFFEYDQVRGNVNQFKLKKYLITGFPHPALAHASFAAHARTEPDIAHIVVPHQETTMRRELGSNPWVHDHLVVFRNGTEELWRRCAKHPLLSDLAPCGASGFVPP